MSQRCCCAQALSKRVHYGKFVAEAKFLAQRQEYTELIRRQDSAAIMDLLTNKVVEKQVRTVHCLPCTSTSSVRLWPPRRFFQREPVPPPTPPSPPTHAQSNQAFNIGVHTSLDTSLESGHM